MKDFVSRLTFGFLMAQFVPGTVIIFSLSFNYIMIFKDPLHSLVATAEMACAIWTDSITHQVIFATLSTAAGMLIHGLQWAVLAFFENRYKSIFRLRWYKWRIYLQILAAPFIILFEIICMIFCANSVKELAVEENVAKVASDKIEAFQFLQDFYLHFAQFYTHTSYALVLLLITYILFFIFDGITINRIIFFFLLYFTTGLMFIIGRIQFQSLFQGEWDIIERKHDDI